MKLRGGLIKMSHDIQSYRLNKIASLHIGMMQSEKVKKEIYTCLDAEEYYNSVSGSGDGRLFNRENLLDAKAKAKSDDVINFLDECIIELDDDDDELFIIFA
jgi:hypothetical protein